MAEKGVSLTLDNRPLSAYLGTVLDETAARLPQGKQVSAFWNLTLKGTDAGIVWQPTTALTMTGYAGRLWGGGWEAGLRGTLVF